MCSVCVLQVDIYVMRLNIGEDFSWHCSCIAGHGPMIWVVIVILNYF
jgi:hypothetical protein